MDTRAIDYENFHGNRGFLIMARALRMEYAGAFDHVTSRGSERKAIFKSLVGSGRSFEIISKHWIRKEQLK